MTFILPKSDIGFHELISVEVIRRHLVSDVLGIPVEEIKSIRLRNPFLRKVHKKQKQAILDAGEDYTKLKRCISICILDFNLDDSPKYHRVYRLRDEEGSEYTDLWEVHVIELNKPLSGECTVDDWIKLFNARNMEELMRIKTNNKGIMEAIRLWKRISPTRRLRLIYEEHLKHVRDQRAIEQCAREMAIAEGLAEGRAIGEAAGRAIGEAEGRAEILLTILQQYGTPSESLYKKIVTQENLDVVVEWTRIALEVSSLRSLKTE